MVGNVCSIISEEVGDLGVDGMDEGAQAVKRVKAHTNKIVRIENHLPIINSVFCMCVS